MAALSARARVRRGLRRDKALFTVTKVTASLDACYEAIGAGAWRSAETHAGDAVFTAEVTRVCPRSTLRALRGFERTVHAAGAGGVTFAVLRERYVRATDAANFVAGLRSGAAA